MDATVASKVARKTGSVSGYESPLQWLQGTWIGKGVCLTRANWQVTVLRSDEYIIFIRQDIHMPAGQGRFPTIKSFSYNEEIQITGDNSSQRPVLHWRLVHPF